MLYTVCLCLFCHFGKLSDGEKQSRRNKTRKRQYWVGWSVFSYIPAPKSFLGSTWVGWAALCKDDLRKFSNSWRQIADFLWRASLTSLILKGPIPTSSISCWRWSQSRCCWSRLKVTHREKKRDRPLHTLHILSYLVISYHICVYSKRRLLLSGQHTWFVLTTTSARQNMFWRMCPIFKWH